MLPRTEVTWRQAVTLIKHLSTRGRPCLPLKFVFLLQHDGKHLSLSQIKHGHMLLSDDLQSYSVVPDACRHSSVFTVCAGPPASSLSLQQAVQPLCCGRCLASSCPICASPSIQLGNWLSSTNRPEPDGSHALSHTNKSYQHLIESEHDHDRDTEGEQSRERKWCCCCCCLQHL